MKRGPIMRFVRSADPVHYGKPLLKIDWVALACTLGFHDFEKWKLADDGLSYFRWIKYKRTCKHCGYTANDYVER